MDNMILNTAEEVFERNIWDDLLRNIYVERGVRMRIGLKTSLET